MSKDFDTIVVPCKDKQENREMLSNGYWAAVRIAEFRKNKLQYIAIYRTAPTSAITEYYKVINIEKWEKNKAKCKIFFDRTPCQDLDIKYNKDNDPIMRASRYTLHNRLKNAKNLKELFCYS